MVGGGKADKKAKATKVLRGVQFPPDKKQERNSTDAVKVALAASTHVADAAAASRVLAEKNWRYGYSAHLVKNCELLASGPTSLTAEIALAGLEALHSTFEFVDAQGKVQLLAEAMAAVPNMVADFGGFDCGIVIGSEAGKPAAPMRVPYQGKLLEGGPLKAQLQQWEKRGIIEADARDALSALGDRAAVDLAGRHFACIGASSEMGPVQTLLSQGATVYAIDVPKPEVWRRLLTAAAGTRGTLVAPLRRQPSSGGLATRVLGRDVGEEEFCEAAGCNVLEQTPQTAAWICAQASGQRLTVGSYVYLDGASFVRVALAADAVLAAVCAVRPDAALACLSSPTECYAVPSAVWDDVGRRLASPPAGKLHRLWYAPLHAASGGKFCAPARPVEASASNPGVPLASPLLLFSENALHVGSWHAAFHTNSYTEVCALTYAAGKAQPYVAAGFATAAGAVAWKMRSKL